MAVVRYIPSLFRLIFFDSLGCESFKSSIVAKKRKEKSCNLVRKLSGSKKFCAIEKHSFKNQSRGSEVSGRETRLTMPELDPWDILNLNKRKISDNLRIYHVISYRQPSGCRKRGQNLQQKICRILETKGRGVPALNFVFLLSIRSFST